MHGYFSDVEVIIRPAIPQGGAGEWRLVAEKVTYEISAETNSAVVTLRVVPRRNSVKMEQFEGTCISHGADDIAASSTDNPAADGHSMPQLNATAGRESADVNMPVESDTQSDVAPLSNNSVSNVDGEITHSPLPQTKAAKLNRTIKSSMKKKRNSGAAATSRVMREPVRSVGATRRNGNLARLRSTAARCSVPNCPKIAIGTTRPTDQHGAMGRRCTLHGGGIRCNIPTCTRHAIGRAVEASASGPRGRRCRVHGGGLACAFPGCANQGFGKSHEPCTETACASIGVSPKGFILEKNGKTHISSERKVTNKKLVYKTTCDLAIYIDDKWKKWHKTESVFFVWGVGTNGKCKRRRCWFNSQRERRYTQESPCSARSALF
eukprot:GEMP01045706.1.p1 GENE.GEMP01045706.1~~GEMP01045706.1.p1  ORF type:complete len:379 (+),score=63.33 GEMP01045706.1:137-1273(+)